LGIGRGANNSSHKKVNLLRNINISLGLGGPKRDEITGGWRKLYNEELHDLYAPPNIIRMIKSRRMRLAGHLARIGGKEKWV
jgi:hypothetical protein